MLKLFVGLGNPGGAYALNRHNVGFMAADRIHVRWRGGPWRQKFQSDVAEATIDGVRVMFLKPMTFMNDSGRAVAEAARFYKLELSDIIVAHDEIDLPPGRFRMKTGGGTGGHNGLRSMSAQLKDGYRRLRIGVGHPGRKEAVPGYVLHDFAKADAVWLDPMLDAFAEEAPLLAAARDAEFASKVHLRLGDGARSDGAARRAARTALREEVGAPLGGGPAVGSSGGPVTTFLPALPGRSGPERVRPGEIEADRTETDQAEADQFRTRHSETRQVETWQGETRQVETRQVETRQGETRQGETRQVEAGQAETRQREANQGEAGRGETLKPAPSIGREARPSPFAALAFLLRK